MTAGYSPERLAAIDTAAQRALGPDGDIWSPDRYVDTAREVPGLIAEIRRLTVENEQLADLDAAATRRAELQAERDRAVQLWHDEHKRAEALNAERDELRTQIGNARSEIRTQSVRHHAAECGSPVNALVEGVLAAVEAHLVDPDQRDGGAA